MICARTNLRSSLRRLIKFDPTVAGFVGSRLRASDREEVSALLPRGLRVEEICAWHGVVATIGVAAIHRGLPAACVGAVEQRPGVFDAFLFATEDWAHVAQTVTKWAMRVAAPALIARGAHRVQASSIATHGQAHGWLRWLGARVESRQRGYGRGGQDFLQFVWTPGDVPEQPVRRQV